MKKYQLNTKTDDILKCFPALCKRLESAERLPEAPGVPRVLCLGADLEKAGACVAVQCGLGEPLGLGTLTRETLLQLVAVLRARGWRCVVGMEACGFGWDFQQRRYLTRHRGQLVGLRGQIEGHGPRKNRVGAATRLYAALRQRAARLFSRVRHAKPAGKANPFRPAARPCPPAAPGLAQAGARRLGRVAFVGTCRFLPAGRIGVKNSRRGR